MECTSPSPKLLENSQCFKPERSESDLISINRNARGWQITQGKIKRRGPSFVLQLFWRFICRRQINDDQPLANMLTGSTQKRYVSGYVITWGWCAFVGLWWCGSGRCFAITRTGFSVGHVIYLNISERLLSVMTVTPLTPRNHLVLRNMNQPPKQSWNGKTINAIEWLCSMFFFTFRRSPSSVTAEDRERTSKQTRVIVGGFIVVSCEPTCIQLQPMAKMVRHWPFLSLVNWSQSRYACTNCLEVWQVHFHFIAVAYSCVFVCASFPRKFCT